MHERDPTIRMPSGDGTAEDVTVPAALISASDAAVVLDTLRQARAAHHVATGAPGAVWVLFSAPGACQGLEAMPQADNGGAAEGDAPLHAGTWRFAWVLCLRLSDARGAVAFPDRQRG